MHTRWSLGLKSEALGPHGRTFCQSTIHASCPVHVIRERQGVSRDLSAAVLFYSTCGPAKRAMRYYRPTGIIYQPVSFILFHASSMFPRALCCQVLFRWKKRILNASAIGGTHVRFHRGTSLLLVLTLVSVELVDKYVAGNRDNFTL